MLPKRYIIFNNFIVIEFAYHKSHPLYMYISTMIFSKFVEVATTTIVLEHRCYGPDYPGPTFGQSLLHLCPWTHNDLFSVSINHLLIHFIQTSILFCKWYQFPWGTVWYQFMVYSVKFRILRLFLDPGYLLLTLSLISVRKAHLFCFLVFVFGVMQKLRNWISYTDSVC